MLESAGFSIAYYPMDGDEAGQSDRPDRRQAERKPLCFSGHTDVVPLGAAPWSVSPFAAEIADGKLYGRGSTDMKGGVAAFVAAAVDLAPNLAGTPGLVLVITASEESGCEGANFLVGDRRRARRGGRDDRCRTHGQPSAQWAQGRAAGRGRATGITAHGSMPEQGDNAVYKAARVVGRLETLRLDEGRTSTAACRPECRLDPRRHEHQFRS